MTWNGGSRPWYRYRPERGHSCPQQHPQVRGPWSSPLDSVRRVLRTGMSARRQRKTPPQPTFLARQALATHHALTHQLRSGVTTPHPQPKDRRMRKAAETPCKQRPFRDPPRTPAGPLPDPFPSNTPATRAAPATTNLAERLEHPPSKRLGPFRDSTVGPGLPSPPVNAVGASAGRRAGAPAPAEALPSRMGGRHSDESEGKGGVTNGSLCPLSRAILAP